VQNALAEQLNRIIDDGRPEAVFHDRLLHATGERDEVPHCAQPGRFTRRVDDAVLFIGNRPDLLAGFEDHSLEAAITNVCSSPESSRTRTARPLL
jgi:hypothetical protein